MVAGGMHGCGGHAWLQGACMVVGGHVWLQGGMHGCRGVCMVVGGHVVAGVCMVAGGVHGCRGVVVGGHAW